MEYRSNKKLKENYYYFCLCYEQIKESDVISKTLEERRPRVSTLHPPNLHFVEKRTSRMMQNR